MMITEFERDGVWVTHARPAVPAGRPPLLFVHGAQHASWCWEHLLPFFDRAGWECLALDWFNHGRSAKTDPETFLHRKIADVTEEIGIVLGTTHHPAVLVGHSMGGPAALAYAAGNEVSGLVLLAPASPAGLGVPPLDFQVNPDELFEPMPFDVTWPMFFTSLDETTARRYYALLGPESPRAVLDAVMSQTAVDLDAIDVEALVFAGERDVLCPPAAVELLARALSAEYVLFPERGHDDLLLLNGCWQQVATTTLNWLTVRFG